jgi:hypothetical protein
MEEMALLPLRDLAVWFWAISLFTSTDDYCHKTRKLDLILDSSGLLQCVGFELIGLQAFHQLSQHLTD